jgi:hypothetical protein
MKKGTTILTAAVLVIVMGLLLVVYMQGNASEPVSGNMTIELYDAPATIHQGNLTVWTYEGGQWTYTTATDNSGNTTWVFEGLTNMTSSYDMLMAASSIAGFTVETDNQVQGTLVTAIDGIENNDPAISGGEKAWQFLVDGTYANRAANKYPISEGSEVTWRYMTNQFNL